jgi:hypothetical protein
MNILCVPSWVHYTTETSIRASRPELAGGGRGRKGEGVVTSSQTGRYILTAYWRCEYDIVPSHAGTGTGRS